MPKLILVQKFRPSFVRDMRAKIRLDRESIRKLKSLGLTRRGIAYALSVCERTVTPWVNTETNVHLRKSTGQPKKVTRILAEEILNHLSIHPHTTQNDLNYDSPSARGSQDRFGIRLVDLALTSGKKMGHRMREGLLPLGVLGRSLQIFPIRPSGLVGDS